MVKHNYWRNHFCLRLLPFIRHTARAGAPLSRGGGGSQLRRGSSGGWPVDEIPEQGDNFKLVGPWRLLTGETWHGWEVAAAEAELKAARHAGDALGIRRAAARLGRLRARGAAPVTVARR